MKTLKIFILAISLLISGQIHANMKEYSESWLQRTDNSGGPSNAPGTGYTGGETVTATLEDLPISDGVYVLLALAGAYMLVRKKKKVS
ncbi:MAG: hypothetical protein LBI82_11960 [Dysgonamonadaceae bacterium]|jgi:hypothetical protein|nr:hypothetical protein [Dysgonamonadaceae bacterium]